jgi:hypothetical protein
MRGRFPIAGDITTIGERGSSLAEFYRVDLGERWLIRVWNCGYFIRNLDMGDKIARPQLIKCQLWAIQMRHI